MSQFLISRTVQQLKDYQYLKRKFDSGYLRQIDKFFSVRHRDRWLLVNSFFLKNVLETHSADTADLLALFSIPLPFIVFLQRLSDRFHLNLSHPRQAELEKCALLLAATRMLIHDHFVVTEDFNEYAQLNTMRRYLISNPPFAGAIYIIPTLDCNFRCPGCLIYRGNRKKAPVSMMTPDAFEYMHNFLLKSLPTAMRMGISYIYYGGEPLLNKPLIEYASRRIRELQTKGAYGKLTPQLSIVTNGSLIDDEFIAACKRYGIDDICVSLDGIGDSHNASRVFPGGGSTFKTVLAGIRRLERNSVKYSLSWTIGPKNIDFVAKDLEWVARHLNTRLIAFNIIRDFSGKEFRKEDEAVFFSKMHHIYDVLLENGLTEGRLQRYRFTGKKRSQLMPYPYYCCAVGEGQFVMRPDGKIGICHAGLMQDEAQWQSPKQIVDVTKDPVHLEWRARTPVFIKECYLSCNYFGFCPGGCAYRVQKAKGSMYDVSEDVCMVERFLIERALIEDYLEKGST